MFGARSEIR